MLGSFEVRVAGREIVVIGRARVLLAVLALSANRAVPADTLAEYVWGDEPPQRIRGSLQTLVARLRSVLGAEAIETTPQGYRLRVDPDGVDVLRFRRLLDRAGRIDADPGAQPDAAADGEAARLAVALWRGAPLADVDSDALRRDVVPGLEEHRMQAVERRLDAELAAGRHREVLGELRELVDRHPLREALAARLILALHRCGRRAEGLAAYRAVADQLREELGLDPGAELQDLHAAMLRDDPELGAAAGGTDTAAGPPAAAVGGGEEAVPRQLPADVRGFTGRAEPLAALDALAAGHGEGGPATTITVDGTAGVGKTALAVHWAHRVAERFPDGQLYLDLRGYGPREPAEPTEAAEALLRALGVGGSDLPRDLDARSTLLRSMLAGRRMLLLLDNARDSQQVRPLLPATGCLVLVTSRRQLRGLVARDGAHRVSLDQLGAGPSLELLRAAAGAGAIAADPVAADAVIRLCGGLPLALRLVAERIAGRSGAGLGRLADRLADERTRLAQLDAGEDATTDLSAVISWSYDALDPPAARMFTLLGLHPGDDIGVPAAAALAGPDEPDVSELLERLADLHLLEVRGGDRYGLHDLLRSFAVECIHSGGRAEQVRAARGRLLAWLVHTATNARSYLTPRDRLMQIPIGSPGEVRPVTFDDYAAALAWCDRERPTMVAAVARAAEHGHDRECWELAATMWQYLYVTGRWQDMLRTSTLGLAAARRLGDVAAEKRSLLGQAEAYQWLGALPEAIEALEAALKLSADTGREEDRMQVLVNLASALGRDGQFEGSVAAGEEALGVARRVGSVHYAALALNNLAMAHVATEDFALAVRRGREATELHRSAADEIGTVMALDTLGMAHAGSGDDEAAMAAYREAIRLAPPKGMEHLEAVLSDNLAVVLRRAGRDAEADTLAQRAQELRSRDSARHGS